MDHRIIKYYAGELSKEERKALLQEAFSNQELKKEMINCQHLQSLVKLHPQEKNELSGKESLKRFMKARQIEKAQLLLLTEELAVKEIAFRLAFEDYSYFNRLFKKITSMTPQEYRRLYSH